MEQFDAKRSAKAVADAMAFDKMIAFRLAKAKAKKARWRANAKAAADKRLTMSLAEVEAQDSIKVIVNLWATAYTMAKEAKPIAFAKRKAKNDALAADWQRAKEEMEALMRAKAEVDEVDEWNAAELRAETVLLEKWKLFLIDTAAMVRNEYENWLNFGYDYPNLEDVKAVMTEVK